MHLFLVSLALACSLAGQSAVAEIYRYTDDNGVTHITNIKPPPNGYVVVTSGCETRPSGCGSAEDLAHWRVVPLNLQTYSDLIETAAIRHGVEAAFIRSIIHAESSFDPFAISSKGAKGLMQLMPATAQRFGVSSPFLPQQNIEGGVKYLAVLLKMFNYDVQLASAAYNAGENAVLRHDGIPPYNETQNYVKRVNELLRRYRRAEFAYYNNQ